MNSFSKGLIAGFIATVALSALMLLKANLGLFPKLNAINMQWNLLHRFFDAPAQPMTGWISHFVIGTVLWGGIFGGFNKMLPGRTELAKGVALSIGAWFLMMVIVMPLAKAGFFGMRLGLAAPIVTLALHIIFGIVLGFTYAKLIKVEPQEELPVAEAP